MSPYSDSSVFTEKLFQYPCRWNYRPDHCMYMSNCRSAEEKGISIIHGNRGVYHNDKQPIFKAVYEAIRDVSMTLTKVTTHSCLTRSCLPRSCLAHSCL